MDKESSLHEVVSYLREAGTFYIATCEGDQPRVRPFGAVAEFEGKLYVATSNTKKCYGQMINNPKTEISATGKDRSWIRVSGDLVPDHRREARIVMLEEIPSLKSIYTVDDGKLEVLYLKNGTAAFCVFGKEPRVVTF